MKSLNMLQMQLYKDEENCNLTVEDVDDYIRQVELQATLRPEISVIKEQLIGAAERLKSNLKELNSE